MADQHSGSDTCSTVTDTVTEKVQASYIYHGWNCLIYAEKHFNIYLGKDLDDYYALVVSLHLPLSCGFFTCPSTRCVSEEFSPFFLCSSCGLNHDDKRI